MEKTIITAAILVVSLISFFSFTEKKREFTITFTEEDINKHFNKLSAIRQIADESNLPHAQVKFIVLSIDSLQQHFLVQVQKQLPKDSTQKK